MEFNNQLKQGKSRFPEQQLDQSVGLAEDGLPVTEKKKSNSANLLVGFFVAFIIFGVLLMMWGESSKGKHSVLTGKTSDPVIRQSVGSIMVFATVFAVIRIVFILFIAFIQ